MINTVNIKKEQLTNGFFRTGSGNEKILIMGSCRVCPYVNYFDRWNQYNGNRFTIYTLDPFNWCWNINDERINYEEALQKLETDERLLKMLGSVDIFIHEYYSNHGMFNCNKESEKNIYQFGLNPKTDICIPNFNDLFILFSDIITFDVEMRKKAAQDYNVSGKLSDQTQHELFEISQKNLNKFYDVCGKSDIPEMANYFKSNFLTQRFYWNYNHVTKNFTLPMFNLINYKFLNLNIDFIKEFLEWDMFANNYTHLTEYDIAHYGYQWGEEIKDFKTYNKL